MKVQIKIGNLALHGFEYHDHIRISETIKQELSRLITENGLPNNSIKSYTIPRVNTFPFVVESSMNHRTIGKGVARSVFSTFANSKHTVNLF